MANEHADYLVNDRSPRYLHGFQRDVNDPGELPHTIPENNQVTYIDSFTNYGVDTIYGKEFVIAASSGRADAASITNTPAGNIAETTVQAAINELDLEKVTANVAIAGSTKTKITYDSKGLVTAGADATATDIVNTPAGNISATTVQAAIDELDSEKEEALGNPSVDGYVLSSTTAGARSWVANGAPTYAQIIAILGFEPLSSCGYGLCYGLKYGGRS